MIDRVALYIKLEDLKYAWAELSTLC